MTQFTLSQNTQNLINTAVSSGPGANNVNYLNAYNAIYSDIQANGSVNSGTAYWFSQAGLVNTQLINSNAPGTFIWNFTEAAVAKEGGTLTNAQMQTASNDIAHAVFTQLQGSTFVFNDTTQFSPKGIVTDDAGVGMRDIQNDNAGVAIDDAAWGGTLFARTALNDPTYITDNNLNLTLGSQDCLAIMTGLDAAAASELKSGYIVSSLLGLFDVDMGMLDQCGHANWGNLSASDPSLTVASGGSGIYDINLSQNVSNGGTYSLSTAYNSNNGTWSATSGDTNSSGQAADQTTFSYTSGSLTADLEGLNSSGGVTYTQDTTTPTTGQVSATITGQGDTTGLSDASISLAAGAQAAVDGANNAVSVAANGALTLAGSGNTATESGNTSQPSGTTITVAGPQETVDFSYTTVVVDNNQQATTNGTGNTITVDAGASATVTGASNIVDVVGNNATLTDSASHDSVTISATGDVENVSNATITLANGASCTITGTGDTVICGNNDTVTVGGSSDTLDINGTNSTVSDSATSDTINDGGSGNSLTVTGTNDAITITGGSENTTVNGNGDSITVNSSASNDGVTMNGSNANTTDNGSGVSVDITGSNDGVYLNGTNENLTLAGTSDGSSVTGSGNGIYLTGHSDNAGLNNSSEDAVLSGTSDYVGITGTGDGASMSGTSDTTSLGGVNQYADSSVAGETINLLTNYATGWDTVNATSDTVNVAIQDRAYVNGSSNQINASYDLLDFTGGGYNTLDATYSNINDFDTTGDWLTGSNDEYDGVDEAGYYNGADPIVLNLSGQQVQTVGLTDSNTYFDMQNDGARILTGWVTPGEGFLVYDPAHANTATSDANFVSSFSQLEALDSNHDGVLNSKDAAWSNLKVWVDASGEGNFNSSSLYTLAQLGITSINLNAQQVNQNSNGNTIVGTSTFTLANGSTGDIAGVNFLNAPNIGTSAGPTQNVGQLTTSAFNQLVSAAASFNPNVVPGQVSTLSANDNSSQTTQLASSH